MPALPSRLVFLLAAAGLLFACRTPQRGAGALAVSPLYNPAVTPLYLGVDGPHLFAHGPDANADVDLEEEQDGCARGTINGNPIEVCQVPDQREKSDSVKAFRLNGPLGTRTFTLDQRGDRVYVDFGITLGRAEFIVPEGLLRQHPEMVAAAWFYGAFGIPRSGSETQAYLIRPRDS